MRMRCGSPCLQHRNTLNVLTSRSRLKIFRSVSRTEPSSASVVEQDVDAAELLSDGVVERFDFGFVGERAADE